ncbi:hypothetical protein [Clostridium sp. AF50-3]|uniref:hypothetical protein n=1 Tax=Clostridium sp. AF50-3 TaxID=2293021 RepID=UPI0026AAD99A
MKNRLKILSIFLASAIFMSACQSGTVIAPTMSAERTEQFQEAIRSVAESMAGEETTGSMQERRTETAEQTEAVQSYLGSPYCVLDGNKRTSRTLTKRRKHSSTIRTLTVSADVA